VILVGVAIAFFLIGGDKDSINNSNVNIIDCGKVSEDIDFYNKDYLKENSDIKKNLECSSINLRDCNPSKIIFLNSIESIFSVGGKENNNCIVKYKSGDKAVECKFTLNQLNTIYKSSEEVGNEHLTSRLLIEVLSSLLRSSPIGEHYESNLKSIFGFSSGVDKKIVETEKFKCEIIPA
jgi:hypothetical protein|tara:strand:- start:376 stop:912 length:537 start_codon:yes stop_codon:yes gene_type:complete